MIEIDLESINIQPSPMFAFGIFHVDPIGRRKTPGPKEDPTELALVEAGGVISEPRSFDGVLARGQVESLVIGRRLRKHTPLRRAGELSLIIE